ncbi:MAG: hypothetical protein R2860_17005 [Desulfobacterales bacterium]
MGRFDWRTNIALVGGFVQRRVSLLPSARPIRWGGGPEAFGSLSASWPIHLDGTRWWRFSLIIFTIFYAPCFVAVVCIGPGSRFLEMGAFSMVFNTTLRLCCLGYGVSVGIIDFIGSKAGKWILSLYQSLFWRQWHIRETSFIKIHGRPFGWPLIGCTSSQDNSGGCASCAACVQITNQSAKTVQDEKIDTYGKEKNVHEKNNDRIFIFLLFGWFACPAAYAEDRSADALLLKESRNWNTARAFFPTRGCRIFTSGVLLEAEAGMCARTIKILERGYG